MNAVFKLLNPDNTVTVNRPLAHALGANAALVYSALISKRAYYEKKGWLNENGSFFSTVADLQESTTLTKRQQGVAIQTLIDAGLIERCKDGMPAKRCFQIVKDVELLKSYLEKGEKIMTELNPAAQKSGKNVPTSGNETDKQVGTKTSDKSEQNVPHTYNPNNKSKEKNPNQSIPADAGDVIDRIDNFDKACSVNEREEYLSLIHENIDYDYLTDKSEKEKIDELVDIMLDVICSTKDTVRVNGEDVPREVVKSRFLKLDSSHVDYVLTSLGKNTTDVRNIRAYLITALYNAPATIDSYYTAWVNHDMRGG